MSLRVSLFKHLQATVRDVFVDADVYPVGALPKQTRTRYVTFQRISAQHQRHLGGGSGLVSQRWQIDCWARTMADAELMSDAIRVALDNRTTAIGDGENLTPINAAFLEDDSEEFTAPTDKSQIGHARVRMDFMIWHSETVTPGV